MEEKHATRSREYASLLAFQCNNAKLKVTIPDSIQCLDCGEQNCNGKNCLFHTLC